MDEDAVMEAVVGTWRRLRDRWHSLTAPAGLGV